jgi:hypothetical protein
MILRNQLMLILISGQMAGGNSAHRMEQSRTCHRQRHQGFLERIPLTIIGVRQKATTKRHKVMDVRNRSTIYVRELYDETLA